jgi:hypothetical protein
MIILVPKPHQENKNAIRRSEPPVNDMDQDDALPQALVEQIPPAEEETDKAEDLYDQIQASQDKLFFIQYAADHTFRLNWYVVRISAEQ